MDGEDITKWVFYGFLAILGLYMILFSQTIHWEDMFVAIGTIILAFFTWKLAISETEGSREMRQLMLQEAINERRRLRIKEQLEGLYSPLIGYIDIFHIKSPHTAGDHRLHKLMQDEIRRKYEFLASSTLIEELRIYYGTNLGRLNDEKWSEFIKPIKEIIASDYHSLIEEYNELTKP